MEFESTSGLGLDGAETALLSSLAQACEAAGGCSRLETEKSLNIHPDMPSFFLAREGDRIIGALSIFAPMLLEAEFGAMVLPASRRRGVFKALLDRAEAEVRRFGYAEELLVVDSRSESGRAAAASLGARHEFTEYAMRFAGPLPPARAIEGFKVLRAGLEHVDLLVALRADEPGEPSGEAESFVRATFAAPNRQQHAAFVGGRMVGACSLGFEERRVSINALAVEKDSRGKGYGQALLREMVAMLEGSGLEIVLDVESRNENAFHIYRKLGFLVERAVEYHRRPVPARN